MLIVGFPVDVRVGHGLDLWVDELVWVLEMDCMLRLLTSEHRTRNGLLCSEHHGKRERSMSGVDGAGTERRARVPRK